MTDKDIVSKDLDETIQYHKGMADEYESRAKCHSRPQPGVYGSGRSYLKLMEHAREHRQLSEWLRELTMYRSSVNILRHMVDDDNGLYKETKLHIQHLITEAFEGV